MTHGFNNQLRLDLESASGDTRYEIFDQFSLSPKPRYTLHVGIGRGTAGGKNIKIWKYVQKTCLKRPLSKRPQISIQDQLSLNAGQRYCRMVQWEHFAILLTLIKLPFVIKIFILSIFK